MYLYLLMKKKTMQWVTLMIFSNNHFLWVLDIFGIMNMVIISNRIICIYCKYFHGFPIITFVMTHYSVELQIHFAILPYDLKLKFVINTYSHL